MLLDAEARDLGEVAADRREAKRRVLLPVPVGTERGEAANACFACRERRGSLAHARLESIAFVLKRVVELLHFARRDILRALEKVAFLIGVAVGLAHLSEQRAPAVRGRSPAGSK